ncbi:MAG: hypothetical protein HY815_01040 [Candidatus Riflebacteria bacterium]|nr:hypothetical protein [Candidatus Riflebacteria bacterium]
MSESLPEHLRFFLEPMVKQCGEVTPLIRGYDQAIEEEGAADPVVAILTRAGRGARTP